MTREIKLALILSFVLILVVGVLVSDHYSQANAMDPDRLDQSLAQPLAQLPGAERNRTNTAIDRVLPTDEPVVIANRSSNAGSLLQELSNGITRSFEELQAPALVAQNTQSQTQDAPVHIQNRNTSSVQELGQIQHATYTVREGDSLYRIAARLLGDGSRWQEIQDLNMDKVGARAIVNPGMKLKLPANARVSAPVVQTIRLATTQAQSSNTYTVVSGDTLGEISTNLLGTSRRTDEFVELNGLDDVNDIRVGMKLKVPNSSASTPQTQLIQQSSETYTVVSGDTLGEISMKLLGTSRRTDEFVELNGLDDVNDIRVGMKLKVPSP